MQSKAKMNEITFKNNGITLNNGEINSQIGDITSSYETLTSQNGGDTSSYGDLTSQNGLITAINVIITNNGGYVSSSDQNEMNEKINLEEEITNSIPLAVQVQDVYYTYHNLIKKRYVLNGLDINVPKGKIYALLGPSGCGKSTLLKCLLGTFVPNRGYIILPNKWKIPGPAVGYMPQELALSMDLTTQETLWLFGTLNGVPPDVLSLRIKVLREKFQLAPGNRTIGHLSGGQMRRVSLACALLHEPPLLILDEPTVGLDPLLRKIIWEYMLDLTETKNTTILLTTHYIEEAKDAHVVGLMRDGKLLAENGPSELLTYYNECSLERCFYRVCENKESGIEENPSLNIYREPTSLNLNGIVRTQANDLIETNSPKKSASFSSLRFALNYTLPSLVSKNVKLLKRQLILLFFQFALPSLVIIFCGICLGTKIYDLPIGIFNEESPADLSLELLRHVGSNPLEQHLFEDKNSAIDFVRSGKSVMTLHIPDRFSECLRNRIELGLNTPEEDVNCSYVYLHADRTNLITSLEVQFMLIRSFEMFQKEYITNYTTATPLLSSVPLSFDKPIYGDTNPAFNEFIAPAILLNAMHFLAAILAAFNLISEKESGVLERFSICGVSKIQIFLGQLLTSTIVLFVQVILLLATQFLMFDTKVYGSYVLVVVFIVLQGFCGMLNAFLISAIVDSVMAALLGGLFVYLSSLFLCGIIWPLEGMPVVLQWGSRFLPMTQTIVALRSVMAKGWGLEHFQVQMGMLSVVSWSAFFLLAAIFVFRAKT